MNLTDRDRLWMTSLACLICAVVGEATDNTSMMWFWLALTVIFNISSRIKG